MLRCSADQGKKEKSQKKKRKKKRREEGGGRRRRRRRRCGCGHLYVEGWSYHLAVLYELWHYGAYNVNRDGKTHTSRGTRVGEDGSIHSNHTALHNINLSFQ